MVIVSTALAIARLDGLERPVLRRHALLIATTKDIALEVPVSAIPNIQDATVPFNSVPTVALELVLA